MKLFYVAPEGESPPLLAFLDALEPKLRRKLMGQFLLLLQPPLPREPHVKHFTIARYSALYELRARSKVMVRIVFTIMDDGSILFLTPFIKRHSRNTMQALDASLKLLSQINGGTGSVKELTAEILYGKG